MLHLVIIITVLISLTQEALTAAFNASNQYADTFEPHRDFFKENEATDLELIRAEERDLAECELSYPNIYIISTKDRQLL